MFIIILFLVGFGLLGVAFLSWKLKGWIGTNLLVNKVVDVVATGSVLLGFVSLLGAIGIGLGAS